MSEKPHGRAAFAFIFVTVVLDMLALGVMIPVLPKLLVQFENGDMASAARISGVFSFIWALMQFVFAPVLGALSDRYGRRPLILLSNFGLGMDCILMAVAPTMSWLFLGRMISGITAASVPTASAYIADVTPPEERAGKFGMLGAAFGLGFIVGPAFGGLLGSYSLRAPFWAAALLSLTNACYGFFVLPESLPPEKRSATFSWHAASPLGALKFLRAVPALLGLVAASFLYFLAHESLPSVFVLYTDFRYHWNEQTVGLCLAAVGVCSTLISALLVGPAVKRLGERRAMIAGLLFGTAGFAVYGLASTGFAFMCGVPIMSLWALAGPSMQALMSRQVAPEHQGQLQGALSSMRGICGMLGPLFFTQVFALAISPTAPISLPGAPYLIAAALIFCGLLTGERATRA